MTVAVLQNNFKSHATKYCPSQRRIITAVWRGPAHPFGIYYTVMPIGWYLVTSFVCSMSCLTSAILAIYLHRTSIEDLNFKQSNSLPSSASSSIWNKIRVSVDPSDCCLSAYLAEAGKFHPTKYNNIISLSTYSGWVAARHTLHCVEIGFPFVQFNSVRRFLFVMFQIPTPRMTIARWKRQQQYERDGYYNIVLKYTM